MTAAASAPLSAPTPEPEIQVKKRSGKIVDYQPQKIAQVVKLCLVNGCAWSIDDVETTRFAENIGAKVNKIVSRMSGTVSVETIQDLVTLSLEVENPDIAQAFRTYREEHRKLRLDTKGIFAKRVAFKPYEYPHFMEFKDAIRHSYWVHTEWNFLADIHDFNSSLNTSERNAIKNALLAISQIEIAVKAFWSNIDQRFPKPEVSAVGDTFAESEVRHADAYSHLLEILGLNDDFDEVLSVPAIRRRVDYLEKSLKADDTKDEDFSIKVALFSMFIENCSLFSQFAVIKSFAKHRSMLKDVDNVVQATQREEQLHAMFGAALINEVKKERPEWFNDDFWGQLRSAARDAFEAESDIIDWIFEQGELPFLTAATLKEFVKHRINESFEMIDGGKPVFEIDKDLLQPLDWFNQELKLDVSIDFFHTKSTAYSKHTQSYKGRDLIRDIEEPKACAAGLIAQKIQLDDPRKLSRYWWLNEPSRAMLESGVLVEGVTPELRIRQIADHASTLLDDETFGTRFLRYMKMGFYSLASPIWANFGLDRGLPISCFGSHVEDSIQGITSTLSETTIMSKYGGGTSGYFGEVRPRGADITNNGKSHGSVNFMQQFDTMIKVVSQGSTRRGQFAAYLDADHADFDEFMRIRSDGNPIQDMSFGACFSDEFMNKLVEEEAAAREDITMPTPTLDRWGTVLEKRSKIGTPYMFWTGNANRQAPKWYRNNGMKITHSNLCTEIMLPNNSEESFVCDLSSINLHLWPEIVEEGVEVVVYTLVQLLEAVMTEFIDKASKIPHMEKAVRFATRHRALGMGVLGWHSYFQRHRIAIDTPLAHMHNRKIFQEIEGAAIAATKQLAKRYGEPEVMVGTGRRNSTLMAIAPTKSSSFILGQTSEGIEPWRQNVVVKKTQKGTFTVHNPELERVLDEYGQNTPEVWDQIIDDNGSVQNLDFLSDNDKAVFRTFVELPQMELITHAAERQAHIDQGQSLNLMIDPSVPAKEISDLYIKAWQYGIKSMYYQYSVNAAHQLQQKLTTCTSCEG